MATGRIYDGTGVVSTLAKATKVATTLYVRSTGNDSNVGTLASPLLTIQAAVDRIPQFIDHNFTIDVGTGTFANFSVMNKECGNGYITIQGAMKTATVATGTATGTSDGGTTRTLVHSTQIWTVNDLKGKFVSVTGVGVLAIEKNTATTITVAGGGPGVSLSGKAYTIQDHDTSVSCTNDCWILNVNGGGGGGIEVKQMKFTSASAKLFYTRYCTAGVTFTLCRFESSSGGAVCNNNETVGIYNCVATGATGYGFASSNCNMFFVSQCLVYACGTAAAYGGVNIFATPFFWLDASVLNQGTSGHGAAVYQSTGAITYLEASSNGGSGLYMADGSIAKSNSVGFGNCELHGTGNTRFGMNLGKDCVLGIKGATDITGSLGNYSFNNSFARTWATDFASNGDIVVAEDTFSRVERVD